MKRFIYLFLFSICCNFVYGQYVTIDGRQFKDENGNNYYPLVCNYLVNIIHDDTTDSFLNSWVTVWPFYGPKYDNCLNQADCDTSIKSDLSEMADLGFNAVRIMCLCPTYYYSGYETTKKVTDPSYWKCEKSGFYIGSGPHNRKVYSYHYRVDSIGVQQKLFELIVNTLVVVAQAKGENGNKMKVILITGSEGGDYDTAFPTAYANYLNALSKYISDTNSYSIYPAGTYAAVQKSILGYDLQNEPFNDGGIWPWIRQGYGPKGYTKQDFCDDYQRYYNTIKSNEPHRLITLGGCGARDVLNFDSRILHLDFFSPHIYAKTFPYDTLYINDSLNMYRNILTRVEILMYWVKNNLQMPWIIGENGFRANDIVHGNDSTIIIDGSEAQQKAYADSTINKTYNCNGSGYSWWCYQDESGSSGNGPFWGVIRNGNCTPPCTELYKPIHSVFENFIPPQNRCDCPKPSLYYDPNNHSYYAYKYPNPVTPVPKILTGFVTDSATGNPIKDAYILGSVTLFDDLTTSPPSPQQTETYTFSKDNGSYRIIPYDYDSVPPNDNAVTDIFVSAPGCSRLHLGWFGSTQNVGLHQAEDFEYSSSFSNITVSAYQYRTLQAWNSISVKDCTIEPYGNCDIKARHDILINNEFNSEKLSEIWIHTTETFYTCENLNFPPYKDESFVGNYNEETNLEVKQIQLKFLLVNQPLKVNIYPNPGSGIFTIEVTQNEVSDHSQINVLDLYSRKVFSSTLYGNKNSIDLSKCNEGIYFITVSNSNFSKTEKIIIAK